MSKSNYFSSKSVFGQLISLIDDKIIKDAVKKSDLDRYVKRFKSKDHLISMLFCSFAKCNSLREVSGAMLGLSGKTESFQLSHIPKRSTLSDANKKRKVEFFEDIYNKLLLEYGSVLSDSRIQDILIPNINIIYPHFFVRPKVLIDSFNTYHFDFVFITIPNNLFWRPLFLG